MVKGQARARLEVFPPPYLKLRSELMSSRERKWKEKIKEWQFDKNVPSKDVAFRAAKSQKRQLEESKETVFRRNGAVVDQTKVENFKKQKLNGKGFGERCIPGESTDKLRVLPVVDVGRNTSTHIV